MSLNQVTDATDQFIANERNDFLLLKGEWGAGKTYFWKSRLRNAIENDSIAKLHYAYVTLFGIEDLAGLKKAILSALVDSKRHPTKRLSTVRQAVADIKNLVVGGADVPIVNEYAGSLVSDFIFNSIDNCLICFDDFERKSESLETSQILGLASLLKEQKNCKIVFISNDAKILEGKDREEFTRHSEKLIDLELTYAPLASEAFNFIFSSSDPHYRELKELCLALEIKNLRTLQRVKRFLEDMEPKLAGAEAEVVENVIKSLVLFVWSHYDRSEGVPSLKSLTEFSTAKLYLKRQRKEEISEEDQRVSDVIMRYGLWSFSEYDEPLLDLVEKGYLDTDRFEELLAEQNKRALAKRGNYTFSEVWELFNNSFGDNEEEFISELLEQFENQVEFMDFTSTEDSIALLRALGREDEANKIIDMYVAKHAEKFIPVGNRRFSYRNATDEYLKKKIDGVVSNHRPEFKLSELMDEIASGATLDYERLRFLDTCSVDDFIKFYKSVNSPNLYMYGKTLIDLGELNDSFCFRKSIALKAREALRQISLENNIDGVRMRRMFNIA